MLYRLKFRTFMVALVEMVQHIWHLDSGLPWHGYEFPLAERHQLESERALTTMLITVEKAILGINLRNLKVLLYTMCWLRCISNA